MFDLDFDGHNTLYATHGMHAYAAKCPPQLVKFGIENYSNPADVILDPMVGSGTTIVEAKILGRHAIGFDIDPLSCLIAKVKSTEVNEKAVDAASKALIERVQQDTLGLYLDKYIPQSEIPQIQQDFPNREYWFSPPVREALANLSYHIGCMDIDEDVRNFLWVAFSSIILTKVSVANARDIIHSRHHFFQHEVTPNPLAKFKRRLGIMQKQMSQFRDLCMGYRQTSLVVGRADARNLPLDDKTIDLVFTSPPYATALDYTRAHFLAVGWMKKALGVSLNQYKSLAPNYIGTERGRSNLKLVEDISSTNSLKAASVIDELAGFDKRRAYLLSRYFGDIYKTFLEIDRVLRVGGKAVIVVCPSHIRKVQVPTHQIFEEMAASMGLEIINEYVRTINANRRVLPYVRESFGNRMSTEYVLVFRKEG